MIKVKALTKQKLAQTYGQNILLWQDNARVGYTEVVPLNSFPDFITVRRSDENIDRGRHVTDSGQAFLQLDWRAGASSQYMLVPTTLLEDLEMESYIEKITPVLDKYMPERWHYQRETGQLALYYPELTLKNSIPMEQKVYDLVVIITLKDLEMGQNIQGIRYSFTPEELVADYAHSHLPGVTGLNKFCVGGGSNFEKLIINLRKNFTTAGFEVFLFQLQMYLEWESLEGKPHREMIKVGSIQEFTPNYSGGPEFVRKYAAHFLRRLTPDLLTSFKGLWLFDPSLNPTEVFKIEQSVTDYYMSLGRQYSPYFNDYEITTGRYFRSNQDSSINLPNKAAVSNYNSVFKIKPRLLPSKIDDNRGKSLIKRPSKDFLFAVVSKINQYLLNQTKLDAEARGTTESTNSNNQQVSQQGEPSSQPMPHWA